MSYCCCSGGHEPSTAAIFCSTLRRFRGVRDRHDHFGLGWWQRRRRQRIYRARLATCSKPTTRLRHTNKNENSGFWTDCLYRTVLLWFIFFHQRARPTPLCTHSHTHTTAEAEAEIKYHFIRMHTFYFSGYSPKKHIRVDYFGQQHKVKEWSEEEEEDHNIKCERIEMEEK